MVHVGYVNIRDALDLTTFLHDEDDHVVWYTIFTDLTKARTMFSNEDLSNFRVNYMFHSLHWEKFARNMLIFYGSSTVDLLAFKD